MQRSLFLPAMLSLAACVSGGGQASTTVAPAPARSDSIVARIPQRNDRVRIVFPATAAQPQRFVAGYLQRLTSDTVILARGMVLDTVTLNGGRQLQAVVGSRGHTWTGVGLGALSGGIVGGVIGASTWQPCTDTGFLACLMYPSQGAQMAGAAVLGGLLGGLVGGAIGAGTHTDEWGTVPIAGMRVSLRPNGIGLRFTF